MTDIEQKALVERLRDVYRVKVPNYIDEAADQIEADGQRIAELEAQADHWFTQYETLRDGLVDILARAALGDKQ